MTRKRILLINPWIRDYAAYDLWCKPLALLTLATWLRRAGFDVDLIDCLDRYHPALLARKTADWFDQQRNEYYCGKFNKRLLPPPPQLTHIDRPYFQYGLPEEIFFTDLQSKPKPDLCCISSMMTYWYPSTVHMIERIRSVYPDIPIVVGGIYPTLCIEHAETILDADYVHRGAPDDRLARFINETLGISAPFEEYDPLVEPAFDLVHNTRSLSLMTSVGCPFTCTYCASNYLQPQYRRLPVDTVIDRLTGYVDRYNTDCFAFFDDALLYQADSHIIPLLRRWRETKRRVTFHTPNGLHARFITDELAQLMFRTGFRSLRLSLETTSVKRQQETGGKVDTAQMQRAVNALYKAGFKPDHFAVYLLVGLPGQSKEEVLTDIHTVHKMGARVDLANFSPIPHTSVWDDLAARGEIGFDEPLAHGKTVYFIQSGTMAIDEMRHLRRYVAQLNAGVTPP